MPAEEGGDKYNVIFVIIHPFIARYWFVQHEADLHQPRACNHIEKGLHHPELWHVGSPQLCDNHQRQQEDGLSEQDVALQLHSLWVLHMRHHQGQKQRHAQGLGTSLQSSTPVGQQVLADHIDTPTQEEGHVEREMLPLLAVQKVSLMI